MTENELIGMTFIALYRRSKRKQTYSIDRQKDVCRPMIEMYKIKISDELVLDDHSATDGEQWAALNRLVEEKSRGATFNGILCSDYSRIGRTMDEVERFYLDCAEVGLVLLTQKEGLLSGRDAWVKRNAAAAANERFAENLAIATSTGTMSLIKTGTIPYTFNEPSGFDRMVLSSTGEPLYRLRRIGDSLLKLSPNPPFSVLETFEGDNRNDFPRRQKNEQLILTGGDPETLQMIGEAFDLYFLGDKYGFRFSFRQIAEHFKLKNIVSPSGKPWHSSMVRNIINNQLYTGIGACNRYGTGVHGFRDKSFPKLFGAPRRPQKGPSGKKRKGPKVESRLVKDWHVVRYPQFMSIVSPRARRLARARNRGRRMTEDRLKALKDFSARRSALGDSPYFLTGLVFTDPSELKLHGNTCKLVYNGRTFEYRQYAIVRERRCDIIKGADYKKSVDADALEGAFVHLIGRLASSGCDLRQHVTNMIKAKLVDNKNSPNAVQELVTRKQDAEDHVKMILKLGPKAKQLAHEDVEALLSNIELLEQEIRDTRFSRWSLTEADVPVITNQVCSQFSELQKYITGADYGLLRRIALNLVNRIVFNGLNRQITIQLRLPQKMIAGGYSLDQIFRGDDFSLETKTLSPKNPSHFGIGTYKFQIVREGRCKWSLTPISTEYPTIVMAA